MNIIRNRRDINVLERFRKPEYWPFSQSGEFITNDTVLTDLYDSCNFNIFNPFEIGKTHTEWAETETFELSPTWSEATTSGTMTFATLADPTGGRGGTVKRIVANANSEGYMYTDLVNTRDIRGMLSGKLGFWAHVSNTEMAIDVNIRTLGSTFRATPAYEFQWFFAGPVNNGFYMRRHGGTSTRDNFGDDTTSNSTKKFGSSTWEYWEYEWQEMNFSDYGRILFLRHKIGSKDYMSSHNFTYTMIPYFFHNGATLNQDNTTVRIRFDIEGADLGSGTAYIDDMTFTKYKDVEEYP